MAKKEAPKVSKTLVAIQADYNRLMNEVMESGGEITPAQEAEMEAILKDQVPAKIEGYIYIQKKLEADEKFFKAEAQKLTAAAATLKKAREWRKDTLLKGMIAMNLKEVSGSTYRVARQATADKLVIDETLLPKKWRLIETTYPADKERIKKQLTSLKKVPGAKLQGGWSLRFYTVKER